jgi:gamma-glutamylputrescine oxidase
MLSIDKLSYWEQKTFIKDIDYLIIGAGIVGYSSALNLKKKDPKAKILILEQGYLPSGASSKNAGFACFGSATELLDDIEQFGESIVWETVALRWSGLQQLRKEIGDENLDLQINGSWDLITRAENERLNKVKTKIDYFNEKLEEITGESNIYSIDQEVGKKFSFNTIESSIYNRLEGQIDTGKMNHAFYKKVIESGIHVIFAASAEEINEKESNVDVKTNIGIFNARKVLICTNGFAKQFLPSDDISPARAQVLITEPINDLKIEGTFHYDCGYYYFRNIDNRILLGGGRNIDFKGETTTELANTEQITNKLKELLNSIIFPEKEVKVEHSWAGIMGVGTDKKPIIKAVSKSIYCGVRLGGMGVAIGCLVGKDLADLASIDQK